MPLLRAPEIPTSLSVNSDGQCLEVPLHINGLEYLISAVSMGNPHAVRADINALRKFVTMHATTSGDICG
jgi:hypothetical protein